MQVRFAEHADGRFAPSPTGPLHLGSLRTALVAWLFARSAGARFRVRVEDLDPQRSRPTFEASQLADLQALGIDWDGPVVRQSDRLARYAEALATLERAGRLYPCFCTRAEIREAASAPHGPGDGGYPGTCRALSDAERARRIAAGDQHALRLRAGGELVRGADLADSTPRQILLARLLGLPVPRYAHVPLVLGPDGARLAKRHGAVTLADRDEPVGATLARLAHSLGRARARAPRARPAPRVRPGAAPA
jgi:glutamyl-tRNA synthetase